MVSKCLLHPPKPKESNHANMCSHHTKIKHNQSGSQKRKHDMFRETPQGIPYGSTQQRLKHDDPHGPHVALLTIRSFSVDLTAVHLRKNKPFCHRGSLVSTCFNQHFSYFDRAQFQQVHPWMQPHLWPHVVGRAHLVKLTAVVSS